MSSVKQVVANIRQILTVKRVAMLEALNRRYAAEVIGEFIKEQKTGINTQGKYWFNITEQAAARMFAKAFREGNNFGWFISHGVDYGVYLTLCNDRRHDALTPIIRKFASRYFADVKKIFGG